MSDRFTRRFLPAALVVAWSLWMVAGDRLLAAGAGDVVAQGRAIFEKHQRAVVTVQLVLKSKFSMPGMANEGSESKEEATGTVIDPSGLTVLALSSTDPASLFQSMMGGMTDPDGEAVSMKMETELGDVKLVTHEGTELPAEVVLRDRDLDLAFVRPKTKPSDPMPALDLKQNGTVQVLDEVITINRLGEVAGRAYAASIERILAVVKKPRTYYVPGADPSATGMGCPAFSFDGKLVGIFVVRSLKPSGSGGMLGMSMGNLGITPIILPAETVLKVAQQVPAPKP